MTEDNALLMIQEICKIKKSSSYLDGQNIFWKWVNNQWLGKRSVWTFDLSACWLEETTLKNVKSFWCGENANYSEIFYK